MSKSPHNELSALFRPLLVAGIIVLTFGIICFWTGNSVISNKEEGDGFTIIGIRFLIGGIVSIILGFIAKYHMLIKYILTQISYKRKPGENMFSDWDKS